MVANRAPDGAGCTRKLANIQIDLHHKQFSSGERSNRRKPQLTVRHYSGIDACKGHCRRQGQQQGSGGHLRAPPLPGCLWSHPFGWWCGAWRSGLLFRAKGCFHRRYLGVCVRACVRVCWLLYRALVCLDSSPFDFGVTVGVFMKSFLRGGLCAM